MCLMPANLETSFPPNSYEKLFNNFMTLSDATLTRPNLEDVFVVSKLQ